MQRISDPLELLTAQHASIQGLLLRAKEAEDPKLRTDLVGELAAYITAHLAIEQEVFYVQRSVTLSSVVHLEVLAEHTEIKRVLADLLWLDADDDRFEHTLAALAGLVEGHAAWQDEELFPTVAETASAAVLVELGAQLQSAFEGVYGSVGLALAA
ncbi:MAG: regulator of cell morphosis and signaling [Deltaproteobacteria bacterium]|nr:regulator of cell morphosis and signaling [Deltaproteobacteria bacterium]